MFYCFLLLPCSFFKKGLQQAECLELACRFAYVLPSPYPESGCEVKLGALNCSPCDDTANYLVSHTAAGFDPF